MSQPANPKPDWYALDVDLEPDAREAVEYALMEAGALGTETCDGAGGLLRDDWLLSNRRPVANEFAPS